LEKKYAPWFKNNHFKAGSTEFQSYRYFVRNFQAQRAHTSNQGSSWPRISSFDAEDLNKIGQRYCNLQTWSSSDVYFFRTDELLKSPCVKTRLSPTAQITPPTLNPSSLAVNKVLFNLGVVLLKLGYNLPSGGIVQSDQSTAGNNSQVEDFDTARRLGASVRKKTNTTYGRLVEKCLNCNSGVATKLEGRKLRSVVIVQVVNQLDVCFEQYRIFNQLTP